MDRQMVYPGQIPLETDVLSTNKDAYIALAKLASAVLGVTTLLNGGAVTPTAPASLQVQAAAVEIYDVENIDNTAYSSLAADTTHQIVKQGINLNATTLSCPAPGVALNSINYLIQYGFSETDGGSTVLPYYNASNPAAAWSGPNNSGAPNNTIRLNTVNVAVKAGVAAPTGTQTTPSPDSGFVGGYVVTVANGQTTITSGDITLYSGAPFITETLTQKISQATADLRYAQKTQIQSGALLYGVDTGAADAYVATLSPAITSYTAGSLFNIKLANTNTTSSTINLNALGVKNIKLTSGANPGAGDLLAGMIALLFYDGTNFQLLNPATISFSAVPIQNSTYIYAASTTAANTYTATISPAPSAYAAGQHFIIKFTNTNTGAATINLNSLGAKSIKKLDGSALASGDIASGMIAMLVYDGTNFQLIGVNNANYVTQTQFQNSSPVYAADTGAADAYVATLSPAPTAYTTGMRILIKITNANTGAATINLNSLGVKNIKLLGTIDPFAGEIAAGMLAELYYDGTNFILLNPAKIAIVGLFYPSGNTSVLTTATTKVAINTVSNDPRSLWDSGNTRAVLKRAGVWRISGACWAQAVGNASIYLLANINGVSVSRLNQITGSSAQDLTLCGSFLVKTTTTTDYAELAINNQTGSTLTVGGGALDLTHLAVEYLGSN